MNKGHSPAVGGELITIDALEVLITPAAFTVSRKSYVEPPVNWFGRMPRSTVTHFFFVNVLEPLMAVEAVSAVRMKSSQPIFKDRQKSYCE